MNWSSFILNAVKYFSVNIYHDPLIHSPIDGHLRYSQSLTIVNNAVINTFFHVSLGTCARVSLVYIPKSGISGSQRVCTLNFWRLYLIVLQAVPRHAPTTVHFASNI